MSYRCCKLGEVCIVQRGTTITQKQAIEGDIPVVAGGLKPAYFHNKANRFNSTITISGSGANAGFVNIWKQPIFASDCSTVEVKESDIDILYVYYFLLSQQGYIYEKLRSGAAQPHVYGKDIAQLDIKIPPLLIQQKIVNKLDAIFAEIDKATAAGEANTENAKLYLGKIIDEVIHEKLEKYKELTLNDITEVITCGVAKRPEYVESGIPFLSARNVKNGKMKWDRYEFVSEETHNTLSKYNKPKVGDILYSRVGAGFGDAAIIDKDIEFSIFVSLTLLKVKPVVLNEFLCYYLNSPFIKEVARKNITGTGVGNLNVGAVRLFNIKLPDLKTQNEIIKKLDSISQNGKILIDSYFKKLENLSLVKKSILKQAFNGVLVKE